MKENTTNDRYNNFCFLVTEAPSFNNQSVIFFFLKAYIKKKSVNQIKQNFGRDFKRRDSFDHNFFIWPVTKHIRFIGICGI